MLTIVMAKELIFLAMVSFPLSRKIYACIQDHSTPMYYYISIVTLERLTSNLSGESVKLIMIVGQQ